MQFHYKIQWLLLRILARSYFRVKFIGTEHIPPTGLVILAANHCSYLDPLMVGLGLTRQISFLAKQELFRIPLLGMWLRWVGVFPVARGEGDMKALRTSLRLLKEGAVILLFPEGTRSQDGRLQKLETGVSWLAIQSGVPVLPVYIAGTNRAMPRGAWFPRLCKVIVDYGEVLMPPEKKNKVGRQEIVQFTDRLQTALLNKEQFYKNGT